MKILSQHSIHFYIIPFQKRKFFLIQMKLSRTFRWIVDYSANRFYLLSLHQRSSSRPHKGLTNILDKNRNKPYDEVLGAAQFTERTSVSGQKLSKIVKNCQKLSKVVKSCQKLSKVVKSCQKLSKVVKSCQKLPKVVKSCQKLS